MDWLRRLQPPKYLRYLFYIAYNWYRPYKSERTDAHITAAIFLAIPHMALFFFFADIISSDMLMFSTIEIIIVSLLILFSHYFLFLYKQKWRLYLKEFSHLKKKDRITGTIYLLIYLVTCFGLALYPVILNEAF